MTSLQAQAVKASWKVFRSIDPVMVGDVFYSKLFYDHPQLRSLFKTSKDEQSKKLIDMLNIMVGRLDKLDELSDDIAGLAIRHVHYGVKPQHYKAVGDALLWTLQQGLGADWTPQSEEAWQACFEEITTTMLAAAYG